jgi:hypothetical protein
VKTPTPDAITYTAPKAQQHIDIAYVPPFPTDVPTNEVDAAKIFTVAGDVYRMCINALSGAKKQDEAIRGK